MILLFSFVAGDLLPSFSLLPSSLSKASKSSLDTLAIIVLNRKSLLVINRRHWLLASVFVFILKCDQTTVTLQWLIMWHLPFITSLSLPPHKQVNFLPSMFCKIKVVWPIDCKSNIWLTNKLCCHCVVLTNIKHCWTQDQGYTANNVWNSVGSLCVDLSVITNYRWNSYIGCCYLKDAPGCS